MSNIIGHKLFTPRGHLVDEALVGNVETQDNLIQIHVVSKTIINEPRDLLYNREKFSIAIPKEVMMKRYGDNLPSARNWQGPSENEHDKRVEVLFGGCAVRYDMLAHIKSAAGTPTKHKSWNIFSVLKFWQKKTDGRGG